MLVAVAVVGLVAGVAGLSIAVVAHNRVNQVVEECSELLRRQLQVAGGNADNQALRDLAIVHYDALKEMSGHRSFSLAVLNANGDGVVVSSINGRTETRTYAKAVREGHPVEMLSPEENQALRAARLGKGPVVTMDDPLPDFGSRAHSTTA
jgi:Flp pilus assembly protein TadG